MFLYSMQVDQDNGIANFFWRDGRSKLDYDSFRDVVIFDTTYQTNKYNLNLCTICRNQPSLGKCFIWLCFFNR